MKKVKKQKPIDLRKVTKHHLYPVLNAYVKEFFDGNPDRHQLTVANVEALRSDLRMNTGKNYHIAQVRKVLEAYGEELINGGYYFKRSDFYLPAQEATTV